jgi:Xaa-Pro aminopeptidase
MLTPILSRRRQRRLLDVIGRRGFDAVVVGARRHVYYFAAHWTDWRHLSAFVLFADGRSTLISANEPNRAAAADDVRAYVANRTSTLDDAQPRVLGEAVVARLREAGAKRIGLDASAVNSQVAMAFEGAREPVDAEVFQIRRVKDADELELMRKAIDCCGAMYARAREVIEPGIAEVEVFAELQAVAVEAAGEPLAGPLGNDYACGVPGGPPRPGRTAHAGELYILDLGPVYRGYFSDNARTIAVNRKPTDAQYAASEIVLGCLAVVEREARAGVRCRAIWDAVNAYLAEHGRGPMTHHLGHGVGLNAHEYPHLNPEWDDTLMEGEVFTAEPGLYGEELAGGIRIENQYLVTRDGVECLTGFPTGLV